MNKSTQSKKESRIRSFLKRLSNLCCCCCCKNKRKNKRNEVESKELNLNANEFDRLEPVKEQLPADTECGEERKLVESFTSTRRINCFVERDKDECDLFSVAANESKELEVASTVKRSKQDQDDDVSPAVDEPEQVSTNGVSEQSFQNRDPESKQNVLEVRHLIVTLPRIVYNVFGIVYLWITGLVFSIIHKLIF